MTPAEPDMSAAEQDAVLPGAANQPPNAGAWRSHVAWTVVLTAMILITTAVAYYGSLLSVAAVVDVLMITPLIQIGGGLVISRRCGRPATAAGLAIVVALHAVMVTNSVLLHLGTHRWVLVPGAAVGCRVLIVVAWGMCVTAGVIPAATVQACD